MKLTKEQLAKIKDAKKPEEIVAIAKENDLDLTIEDAKKIFDALHVEKGLVSDEELDNVVGGTCYSKGKGVFDPYYGEQRRYAIVSPLNYCPVRVNPQCIDCNIYCFTIGATWYCSKRWWENGHEVVRSPFQPRK